MSKDCAKKVLVIGYGSIGQRHARILSELECSVAVVSSRKIDWNPRYACINDALEDFDPGYVVIANKTSEHGETLRKLGKAGFKGIVLVEKPLFSKVENADVKGFKKVIVGYNLRFHPLILKLRKLLTGKRILTAQTYVGKNLAAWRPGVDYRKSYSAFYDRGGGVLRDLSHELDYMNWLLGGWSSVVAVGGHYSRLEIDTDDAYCVMMKTKRCRNVLVQMNYIDHTGHRSMIFNSDDLTIKVDLIQNWIEVNGKRFGLKVERDDTYREEHKAVLGKRWKELCSYHEAMDVMRLIEAAEKSSRRKKWVKK